MLFFNPFYIYIFILLLWDTEEKTEKQKKLEFYCTRYSTSPFFYQHGAGRPITR
jgi:hypothetical protein